MRGIYHEFLGGDSVSSVDITGFVGNGEILRKQLSEKITELEQMQENLGEYSADKINDKLKEIKGLQKNIDEYHKSIKKANEEKQTAIEELNRQTKDMKELQASIEKEHIIQEQGRKNEQKKRTHKNYKISIHHTALKALKGVTKSSFIAIAREVILIDNNPYNHKELPLSKERKRDFMRYIEHFAELEVIGKRKHTVKRVYNTKEREGLNDQENSPERATPKK